MNTGEQWHDVYASYWHRIDEPKVWEEELRGSLGSWPPKESEIVEAIRSLGKVAPSDRTGRAPRVGEIRREIMHMRDMRKAKPSSEFEKHYNCELCMDKGWANMKRTSGPYIDTWVSIPCDCPRGRVVYESQSGWTEAARDQHKALMVEARRQFDKGIEVTA